MQKTLSRQLLFFKATNKFIFPNKILPCVLFFLFDILEDSSSLNMGVVGCGEGVVYHITGRPAYIGLQLVFE